MTADVLLVVNGFGYSGWKSLRIRRSIETLAGSFDLDVSDRWADQDEPWPIAEEDPCRVEIVGEGGRGSEVVIDGFISKRRLSMSSTTLSLSYSGKDRAAALVENSLIVEGASQAGNKWTYRNVDIAEFARAIASQFDIAVSVQPGLVLKKDPMLVAHPGETGFEALSRAAGSAGVLLVSDGRGGIVITRAGDGRAAALIQGFNVLAADIEYDAEDRFHRYLIATQVPGTDEASGDATRVQAEAVDLGVKRKNRVIVIRPDKGYNTADARRRADWEARVRAARAEKVTIGVQGWRQQGDRGALWTPNTIALVQVPRIGINGDMLISQVEYSIADSGGQVTQLHLVRPDAFTPEPQATVHTTVGWKELAGGAF